jgi:hypothetical protein
LIFFREDVLQPVLRYLTSEFNESTELFVDAHDKALSVPAVRVNNPADRCERDSGRHSLGYVQLAEGRTCV